VVTRKKNNIEEDGNMEKRRRQLACVGAGACTVREDAIVDATRAKGASIEIGMAQVAPLT
jgi:hypothetical protein